MIRRLGFSVVLSAIMVACPSCAAINVDALPQPGESYSNGYDIVIEFANVLNLPERAKVMLDGVRVGTVTGMKLKSHQVDVDARIGSGVAIPSNVHGELQQVSVLGDIYVALESSPGSPPAPPLGPGGEIRLIHTTSPPQLEDTIARLATFATSGSIQRIQNTIIHLNRVTPPTKEVHRLTSRVASDLSDLSEGIAQVDNLLQQATQTSSTLRESIPGLNLLLSVNGRRGFEGNVVWVDYCAEMFPGLGSIYQGGFWLVPLLHSLIGVFGSMREAKWDFEREVPAWRRLFADFFLPQDRHPAINITSILAPDGRELSGNVEDALRILGATP